MISGVTSALYEKAVLLADSESTLTVSSLPTNYLLVMQVISVVEVL